MVLLDEKFGKMRCGLAWVYLRAARQKRSGLNLVPIKKLFLTCTAGFDTIFFGGRNLIIIIIYIYKKKKKRVFFEI